MHLKVNAIYFEFFECFECFEYYECNCKLLFYWHTPYLKRCSHNLMLQMRLLDKMLILLLPLALIHTLHVSAPSMVYTCKAVIFSFLETWRSLGRNEPTIIEFIQKSSSHTLPRRRSSVTFTRNATVESSASLFLESEQRWLPFQQDYPSKSRPNQLHDFHSIWLLWISETSYIIKSCPLEQHMGNNVFLLVWFLCIKNTNPIDTIVWYWMNDNFVANVARNNK